MGKEIPTRSPDKPETVMINGAVLREGQKWFTELPKLLIAVKDFCNEVEELEWGPNFVLLMLGEMACVTKERAREFFACLEGGAE